jgi:rhodanese-related sulfurtransferase
MYDTFKPDRPMALADFVLRAKACTQIITPMTLLKKLQAKEDLLLIDVREHAEFEAGHISGARLVPRGIIEAAADPTYAKHLPELSSARDRAVVLYCATGGRAAMAAAVLQMMGFRAVFNLDGGYARWVDEGMPEVHEASY